MNARQLFIAAFLVFGLGAKAGQYVEHLRGQAQLGELRASTAEAQHLAALGAVRGLQEAQTRGDVLTVQLAERDQQILSLSSEKRDALKKATSGRACLGTAALRVLDGAAGIRVAGLPEATSGAADADGPVATDADVGQWAIGAGAQYEQCRARLDKLIDWHRAKEPAQ